MVDTCYSKTYNTGVLVQETGYNHRKYINIMKKIILLTIAVLCSPLAMANNSTAPIATPAQRQQAEALVAEMLSAMDEIVTLLEGINSKATADAAADRLPVLIAKLEAIFRKGEAMGDFEYPELEAEMQPIIEELQARVLQAFQNLAVNQCYGSNKLVNAIQNLQNL